VVGYPNLKLATVKSSLLPEVTLDMFRQMLAVADNSPEGGQLGHMSQMMSNTIAVGRAAMAGPSGPAGATPGEAAEDLYLYDIGRVTLAKGERAYVPLLEAKIPFRHRYDWDLPDQVNRHAQFVDREGQEPVPVWHVLQLENRTDAPWTTAPILIQGDKGPLAQSTILYTPHATETTVKLTKALNLVGETFEFRADDSNAPRDEVFVFSTRYEKIEVQGRIELTNRSTKLAPMRITKQLSGDVISAEGDPKIQGQAKGLGQVNASRTLTWTFDLAAGATWSAEYRYRVLIRR
jgi:hypothetical protein